MSEFGSQALWLRLAFLMMTIAFFMYMYAFGTSGWATVGNAFVICPSNGGTCSSAWVTPVEACNVIGFLCSLTAFVLTLCLLFVAEVSGNRQALIAFVVLALLAGLMVLIGDIIFRTYISSFTYSDAMTISSSLVMILAAIFGILQLASVSPDAAKKKVSP